MANRCYQYAAGNDKIIFDTALNISGDKSASLWVNFDTTANGVKGQFFGDSANNSYWPRFQFTAADTLFYRASSFESFSPLLGGDVLASLWYHLLFVLSGTTLTIYRGEEGVDPASDGTTTATTAAWQATLIGQDSSVPTDGTSLDARLFDVRVWSKALSAAERTTVNQFGFVNDSLELWYKCDDTHDTIATDSGPNLNHGTKTNITLPDFHATGAPHNFGGVLRQPTGGIDFPGMTGGMRE